MSNTEHDTAAQIISNLKAVTVTEIGGVPALITPPGFLATQYPRLLPRPQRTEKTVTAHDVLGFVTYANHFKISGITAIFAALEPKPRLHAAIDYHAPELPSHCEHNVYCEMAHSEEWKRWTSENKKAKSQKEFGLFLEDNLKDVVTPAGPDLLQMALNFSSFRSVEFKSSQRLSDGLTQFQYVEGERAGEIKMPDRIKLGLPVFRGEQVYAITARLKSSLTDTKLSLWYELERPDLVVDAAYTAVIERVEKDTGITVFRGAA